MYLTFLEYQGLGGKLEEQAFFILEKKARRKLDYFTQDRIKSLALITSEIRECMVEFIDRLENKPINGNITSYSNGIESFGYADNQADALNNELYQIAVEYLPIELISAYMGE